MWKLVREVVSQSDTSAAPSSELLYGKQPTNAEWTPSESSLAIPMNRIPFPNFVTHATSDSRLKASSSKYYENKGCAQNWTEHALFYACYSVPYTGFHSHHKSGCVRHGLRPHIRSHFTLSSTGRRAGVKFYTTRSLIQWSAQFEVADDDSAWASGYSKSVVAHSL
jgi:hypothetical protein